MTVLVLLNLNAIKYTSLKVKNNSLKVILP